MTGQCASSDSTWLGRMGDPNKFAGTKVLAQYDSPS